MEEIYFEKEARDKLFIGVNKMCKAVSATYGPNGKTVIILNDKGEPYATKDGVSVANNIKLKDPVENIGAIMLRQVAEKTVKDVGDGTTSSIILATAFINNLKDFESKDINKAFDEIIPKVIDELEKNSRKLERENIKYVASISANNDLQIADIIQQAYNHSDIVKVEESNNLEDSIILLNGMQLNVSYFSKHFVTNLDKGECDLHNPYVLIIDGKLENLLQFQTPLQLIAENNKELLIITEDISDNVLRLLESNVLSGNLKLCVIKSPGFSKHRKDLLSDISKFTNSEIIYNNKPVELKQFGKLESCKITKHNSILIKDKSINLDKDIESLNNQLQDKELSEYDRDLLKQRLEYLSGNVSIIKVGGGSELEMKERKDRYDDAVLAVSVALEEGIVAGGGKALLYTIPTFIEKDKNGYYCITDTKENPLTIESAIGRSLMTLSATIYQNGCNKDTSLTKRENIKRKYEGNVDNMFNQNIIDPLKVTKSVLLNSVSIAKVILSTDAVVLPEYLWN